jgi:hypothetical protein
MSGVALALQGCCTAEESELLRNVPKLVQA